MFTGAMTAMVTPFRNGRVDEARLKEQVEYQIAQGIDGLVPVGTTGESPTLDFDEHKRVIRLTVEYAKGRVPVIAGRGGNATEEALELHQWAKEVGCGAVGVISVLSNLIPGEIKKITKAALAGDFKTAAAAHHRLFPLMRAMFLDGNPVGIKYAMSVAGRDSGQLRLPLWEASEGTKKQ